MTKHYTFGGSTAGRTINCPAWVNLSSNLPSGPPSLAAVEGTMMHDLFEQGALDRDFEPAERIGQKQVIDGVPVITTEEHVDKVYTALEELDDIENEYGFDDMHFEISMNTDDDTGGTADIVAWKANLNNRRKVDIFAVGDLKTGDGHMVFAEDNDQLLFYAWQAVEKYRKQLYFTDETTFILFIIQPSERRESYTDTWMTTLKEILAFAGKFKRARKQALAGDVAPSPGPHCSFCPAMATCPAKTGLITASRRISKDSPELGDLIKALSIVDEVEDWCRAVRKLGHEQAEAGVKLEGFKLVPKRAMRVWTNETAVLDKFKRNRSLTADDYLNQQLKSPAQIEKICKIKKVDFGKFESMITLHSSGTTLVKESDPRTEVFPLLALGDMAKRIKK
jgi:hypothetical protein